MAPDLQDPQGVYQQPDYRLTVNSKDVTTNLRMRLIRLTLRESRGEEADTLELELDDSDGRLNIPPKGAKLTLRLGYTRGGQMEDKGEYLVDETEHGGAPDVLSIKARAADLGGDLRKRASGSWHGKTIGDVVRDIARKNKLEVSIEPKLAAKPVQHIDQTDEPDVHFLTRLGRLHDAVATFKKGKLIFLPIGTAENAAGKPLRQVTITRASGDQHRYSRADRDTDYETAAASYHDPKTGKTETIHVDQQGKTQPSSSRPLVLSKPAASAEQAKTRATAKAQQVKRQVATFELTLATGRPDIKPETPIRVQGFRPYIDQHRWTTEEVTHRLSSSGYQTSIKLESA